jgi:Mn-dependent DtxR family transcriptional regulator
MTMLQQLLRVIQERANKEEVIAIERIAEDLQHCPDKILDELDHLASMGFLVYIRKRKAVYLTEIGRRANDPE